MAEGTELVGYSAFLFFAYVYLPYAFLKFGAERSIDLGRRRDFTQFEEIISGFVPAVVLHCQTVPLYLAVTRCKYTLDFSVMASMFGSNRGAVSDYIYSGDWWGCIIYLLILWPVAYYNGLWFGVAVQNIAENDTLALHGIDRVWEAWKKCGHRYEPDESKLSARDAEKNSPPPWLRRLRFRLRWLGWWFWYRFFQESIVPLYSWTAGHPIVLVETKGHDVFLGRFVRYEKTTDGRFEAIRLDVAKRLTPPRVSTSSGHEEPSESVEPCEVGLFLKWSQIVSIVVIDESTHENERREREEACAKRDRLFRSWSNPGDSTTLQSGGEA